jgi:hypothetical protein
MKLRGFFLLACSVGCGLADDGRNGGDATNTIDDGRPASEATQPAAPDNEQPSVWDCLGEVPTMAPRESRRVQYVVPVVDFFAQAMPTAVPDLEVQVCGDAACASELPLCGGGVEPCYGLSVDGPELAFDFPFGLDGALRFSAPGYVDLDYALGGPMVGTQDGSLAVSGNPIAMIAAEARDRFYAQLGRSVDASRGMLMARVIGCDGLPAHSVTVTPLQGDFSDATAFVLGDAAVPQLGPALTDGFGSAGYINVAPQRASVIGSAATGETIESPAVPIRSGAVGLVEVRAGIGVWGQ